jgi:hypothetical protein
MPAAIQRPTCTTTCKALNQVRLWQRESLVEEQRADSSGLRRGGGSEGRATSPRLATRRRPRGTRCWAHAYSVDGAGSAVAPSEQEFCRKSSARAGPVYAHLHNARRRPPETSESLHASGRCWTSGLHRCRIRRVRLNNSDSLLGRSKRKSCVS